MNAAELYALLRGKKERKIGHVTLSIEDTDYDPPAIRGFIGESRIFVLYKHDRRTTWWFPRFNSPTTRLINALNRYTPFRFVRRNGSLLAYATGLGDPAPLLWTASFASYDQDTTEPYPDIQYVGEFNIKTEPMEPIWTAKMQLD